MARKNGLSGEGLKGLGTRPFKATESVVYHPSPVIFQQNGNENRKLLERVEMRFRSSGLGKTELKGKMSRLSPVGDDLLVYYLQTYEPVEWHMRAGLERKDILKIVKGLLRPAVFFHTIRTLFFLKKNPTEPEDILDKSL